MLTCSVAIWGKINPPFLTRSQMTEFIHGDSLLVSSCLFKVVNGELWTVRRRQQSLSCCFRAGAPAEVLLSKKPVKHAVML